MNTCLKLISISTLLSISACSGHFSKESCMKQKDFKLLYKQSVNEYCSCVEQKLATEPEELQRKAKTIDSIYNACAEEFISLDTEF